MLILAGLLILPCLLLAQEQASNPYKPKLAPHLIPGYTHYMIAISERGKDIVNLQSQRSQFLDPIDTRIGQTPTKPPCLPS